MSKGNVKLIMVTADNNNKFYNMKDNDDGTFTVTWGRVGATSTDTTYPIKKWDSIYRNKTKKGYKDITEIFAEEVSDDVDFADINEPQIKRLVNALQSYANHSVQQNYLVTSESVTQKQVDEAQSLVDMLSSVKSDTDAGEANELLLDIYSIIPRRMANVKYYIFGEKSRIGQYSRDTLNRVITNEQATLDVMRGQVSTNTKTKDVEDKDKKTLLDAMGLTIVPINDEDHATIIKLLGPNAGQFKSAVKVINLTTQGMYDKHIQKVKNPQGYLFWHGSRNENWWSILDTGLVLRPANAVVTGKMFGYGLYFADKAQKSIGYTSLRGSYWARGGGDKAYLALFAVHTGNWLHTKQHQSWMYDLTEQKLRNRGDYDSLFAEGGIDLRNNEYIVYNQAQCTVQYLVEIGS